MKIIQTFPLISTLLGCFITFFILGTKNALGKNARAKYSLASIVFIYTLQSIISLFHAKGYELPFWINSLNFASFHFIGILFYYFSVSIIKKNINFKPYLIFLVLFAVFKVIFFKVMVDKINSLELLEELFKQYPTPIIQFAIGTYLVSCAINIYFICKAFKTFKHTPLLVSLDKKKEMFYKWIKLLFATNVLVILILMIEAILVLFNIGTLHILFIVEPIIYTGYFFVFVYSLMQFPIFAFTGDYNDLSEKEKYQNSSLNNSEELFDRINSLVATEQLFLSSDLKINAISEKLQTSVPHISQAINENRNISFSDYINSYRIEAAKQRLLVDKPDTIFAIAIDVGFNNKATFYHAFKKLTNTTPTAFRKENI